MNSIQRDILERRKKKSEGYKAANTGGWLAIMFMLIGLFVWGMNLVINF